MITHKFSDHNGRNPRVRDHDEPARRRAGQESDGVMLGNLTREKRFRGLGVAMSVGALAVISMIPATSATGAGLAAAGKSNPVTRVAARLSNCRWLLVRHRAPLA